MVTLLDRLRGAWMGLTKGFNEGYLSSQVPSPGDYGSFEARQLRYEIYWATYENTAYRLLRDWSVGLKEAQGLYRHVRGIYNPSYRLGEFWKAHLWGGGLDPAAGDGIETPSALPIVTENDRLREALAQIYRWSNWAIQKDVASLWGSVLGDLFLKIVDDPLRGKVSMDLVHPSLIREVDYDRAGNVKGYTIQETRQHPDESQPRSVLYTERCWREPGSELVQYETKLDDVVWDWGEGTGGRWSEPYGFVPLVGIQHNNVGAKWGWSELHAGRGKFQEADDLASKMHDYVRKTVDAPMLITGVQPEAEDGRIAIEYSQGTAENPEPMRQEVPMLFADVGADAKPLIATLDLAGAAQALEGLLKELERDYPELQMDIWTATGDVSGRALRAARARVEQKVRQRRPVYDDALVRAQMMAVSIGGMRSLPGFEGFSLDSYRRGELDHAIGERPVFDADPLDEIEIDRAFWETANQAVTAGASLEGYLRLAGWDEEKIQTTLRATTFNVTEP